MTQRELAAYAIENNFASVLYDEPLSAHSSLKIGGACDIMLLPKETDDAVELYCCAKRAGIPVFVLGNGTNLLFDDEGFRGVIIKTAGMSCKVKIEEKQLTADSGASLTRVASTAEKAGLSGFEFAYGIPGTVGGAVYMNAGAYGGEIQDILVSTDYVDENGELCTIDKQAHQFGYRKSVFMEKDAFIVRSRFTLFNGGHDEIRLKMAHFMQQRREKQPLQYPSAGSIFKRPDGYFAGRLIEEAGLRGTSVGGAMISEKHAGFIINTGGATCAQVLELIELVKKRVYENSGVTLECEVKYIQPTKMKQ